MTRWEVCLQSLQTLIGRCIRSDEPGEWSTFEKALIEGSSRAISCKRECTSLDMCACS